MGVHPHAPMNEGGTVAVPLVCVRVPRGVRPDQKPPEEGRASALRGRLQSVDPTKLNARSFACAPRRRAAGARRGKEYYPLAEASLRSCQYNASGRSPRKKLRASRLCGGPVSVRLRLGGRYFRGLPLLPVYRSLVEGGVQIPWVHAPARGEGVR